ncbi:MAG TPA: glycosyltransferase family 39 protein [Puia sp.]
MKRRNYLFYLVLLLSIFLLFYRLSDLMPFIGDQGWFYLSARDMLLTGKIPLVGITSSHVWLHQGPYWTYMLAGALWLGHFNPVSGAYVTSLMGLFAVFLVYKIGSEVFSKRVGLIASLFYATSPMILINSRIPYHTAPIGLLTLLLFYLLYKWINGLPYGLPLIILLYTTLYNFETATFMLVPIFIILLIYGFYKKTTWSRDILSPKLIGLSVLAWVVVMIPMLLYDIHHGYPQTLKFDEWLVYKIATVFGFPKLHPDAPSETLQTMIPFANSMIKQMVFLPNAFISWIVLLGSFINLLVICKPYFKKGKYLQQYSLLSLFFIIPAIGYIVEKTNSGAYLIVFFPIVAFLFAITVDRLMDIKRFFIPVICMLLIFVFANIIVLFQTNFLTDPGGYGFPFYQRVTIAKQIINESQGKEYNLVGRGNWSQFVSFTMNYEYLTWWLGHGPSHLKEPLHFIIQETPTQIILQKKIKNLRLKN